MRRTLAHLSWFLVPSIFVFEADSRLGYAQSVASTVAQYEVRIGDSFSYQTSRYQGGVITKCIMELSNINGGQITYNHSCDDGFRGVSIVDLHGGSIRRDTKGAALAFTPHNYALPAEPLRVGAVWSGTYNFFRNGQANGYTSKNCSVRGSAPRTLPGYPGQITAFDVECSFKWSEVPRSGSETYKVVLLGGSFPVVLEYESLDNDTESKLLEFRRSSPR
jgi:hypothetical protein